MSFYQKCIVVAAICVLGAGLAVATPDQGDVVKSPPFKLSVRI